MTDLVGCCAKTGPGPHRRPGVYASMLLLLCALQVFYRIMLHYAL